jgi:hypothetical protein
MTSTPAHVVHSRRWCVVASRRMSGTLRMRTPCAGFSTAFKRLDHLVEGDETEPGCRLPRGWNALEQPIGRFQHIRPPPSRAENVPRSKDRR